MYIKSYERRLQLDSSRYLAVGWTKPPKRSPWLAALHGRSHLNVSTCCHRGKLRESSGDDIFYLLTS